MLVITIIVSVFLGINEISGNILLNKDGLVWPTEYHFTCEKFDFGTTLRTPFEIWYSADYNRSRIDFYGGSSKKYYYVDTSELFLVIPVATSNMSDEVFCGNGFISSNDHPDFLPDVSNFSYTGETLILLDKVVDVWTTKNVYKEEYIKEETLYVYKTDYGVNVPVQYVVKIWDEDVGSVDSHYVNNYYSFNTFVSQEDLTVKESYDCDYFGVLGTNIKNDMLMLHPDIPNEADIMFESFTNQHNKDYHENEREKRKRIFENNWRMIHDHNRKNLGFKLELNAFSDRTSEELKYLTGTFTSETPSTIAQPFPHSPEEIDNIVAELPENFDLRLEGVITPVKNQGACGSCWAFATVAAAEGALARANGGRLLDLSEQSLVDCSWSYGDYGCNGGMLDVTWEYVYENGIPTERDYGMYIEHDGYCNIKNMTKVYNIKGFAQVTPHNPNALKVALYKYGPVTVTIHASKTMIQYASGIFYDISCEGERLNHGVTVVGYGIRDGEEYWLVKNSWGEGWGLDGYILMSAKNNNCLLLDTPYYPIV